MPPKKKNSILDSLRIETIDYDQPDTHRNIQQNQSGRNVDFTIHACRHCQQPFTRLGKLKSHEKDCNKRSENPVNDNYSSISTRVQPRKRRASEPNNLQEKSPKISPNSTTISHIVSEQKSTDSEELEDKKPPLAVPTTIQKNTAESEVITINSSSSSSSDFQPITPKSESVKKSQTCSFCKTEYSSEAEFDKHKCQNSSTSPITPPKSPSIKLKIPVTPSKVENNNG